MKANELKNKTIEELKNLKLDLLKEASLIRVKVGNIEFKDKIRGKIIRKTVARINTFLHQKSEK